MQQKYQDRGFVIVAIHRQDSSLKDKALALCRQNKVNYCVTSQGSLPGDDSSGIPRAFLFDWTGKCVAEGHPSEFDSKVADLMATAPHFLTGGRDFSDAKVKGAAGKLAKNKDFGKLAEELEKVEGEEASYLKGRIVGYGESLLARAKASESDNPNATMSGYSQVSGLFKGHELGKQADDRLKELKKDKAFQEELKAFKFIAILENLSGQLKTMYKEDHPANRKTLDDMKAVVKNLEKKYPESKALTRAKEIMGSLSFGES
jgi:hypothetical protein